MRLNCLAWGTQISRGKLKIVYTFQCWRLLRHENDIKICAVKKKRRICRELKGKQTQRQTEKRTQTHAHRDELTHTDTHYQDK